MCGFVAVIDPKGVSPERVSAQTDALLRRGPDDRGVWMSSDGRVALGSRRLAIVDLSPRGHMPMVTSDGKVVIAFNGEIYNYRELRDELKGLGYDFKGDADTEVVLHGYHRWGADVVQRLDGMFGFAIYDQRIGSGGSLFVARDRAGEKPVLIYDLDGQVIVASDLGAILADERVARVIDPAALDGLLALGYLPAGRSLICGVTKLAPAHSMWIPCEGRRHPAKRYWAPPVADMAKWGHAELADEAFSRLKDSVKRQLVADVPVGIFLSGGIDSSLITAAAAEVSDQRIKTFTIAFPGGGPLDESNHARKVAAHFGAEHHELPFTGELFKEFQFVADNLDEPLGDPSILPTSLVSRFARETVTVAIGGDGGDELFGGYSSYLQLKLQGRQRELIPATIRGAVSWGAKRLPIGFTGRARLASLGGDLASAFVSGSVLFNGNDRAQLLSNELRSQIAHLSPAETWRSGLWPESTRTPEQAAMMVDFLSYLPGDILTKVDRASMLHSLEVRAPFLSLPMLQFAFSSVPAEEKISGGRSKVLLKKIASRVLPKSLDIERKQGFSVPSALFGSPQWRDYSRSCFESLPRSWFSGAGLSRLADRIDRHPSAAGYSFLLVLLSRWQQRWNIS